VKRLFHFSFLILDSRQDSLDGGSARRKAATNTQNKSNVHASSGTRTHDPSFRAGEDSSCLRRRGHCDRPITESRVQLCIKRKQTRWRRNDLTLSFVIFGEMGGKFSMTGGDKYFQNLLGNPVGERKLGRCRCRCNRNQGMWWEFMNCIQMAHNGVQ
jgi:hypothetical protein